MLRSVTPPELPMNILALIRSLHLLRCVDGYIVAAGFAKVLRKQIVPLLQIRNVLSFLARNNGRTAENCEAFINLTIQVRLVENLHRSFSDCLMSAKHKSATSGSDGLVG